MESMRQCMQPPAVVLQVAPDWLLYSKLCMPLVPTSIASYANIIIGMTACW